MLVITPKDVCLFNNKGSGSTRLPTLPWILIIQKERTDLLNYGILSITNLNIVFAFNASYKPYD